MLWAGLTWPSSSCKQVGHRAVEDAGAPGGEGGGVLAAVQALAAGFEAHQPHIFVGNEGVEGAHGVAAAADAGHDVVGQAALDAQDLRAGPPAR